MLEHFLVAELYAFFLIFARIGTAMMLMPGIGEVYVSTRIRLLLALAFSAVLEPLLAPHLPKPPDDVIPLLIQITAEIICGAFFGSLARMLISAMHTAGTVIATQVGIATSMMLDVTQTTQSTSITNLLSVLAVTLFFVSDLDHLLYRALIDSYDIFSPGEMPPLADISAYATTMLSRVFGVAMQLAAPHIVIGTILYLAAGVIARLMPSMQIFFILMAPQILIGFFILMLTLSGTMMWYLGYLGDTFGNFINFE